MAVSWEDEPDQSRCPDAYTILAFGVGSLASLAYIGVRWLLFPLWWHARHEGR